MVQCFKWDPFFLPHKRIICCLEFRFFAATNFQLLVIYMKIFKKFPLWNVLIIWFRWQKQITTINQTYFWEDGGVSILCSIHKEIRRAFFGKKRSSSYMFLQNHLKGLACKPQISIDSYILFFIWVISRNNRSYNTYSLLYYSFFSKSGSFTAFNVSSLS